MKLADYDAPRATSQSGEDARLLPDLIRVAFDGAPTLALRGNAINLTRHELDGKRQVGIVAIRFVDGKSVFAEFDAVELHAFAQGCIACADKIEALAP